jgi:hypothetical protein
MRLVLSPWSAAKVEWLLFGGREKRDRDPEKNPSMYRKESRTAPFSTGRICSRAVALPFVSIAHHVSKSDVDKLASRE